jgi:hypothetical protein
MIREHMNWGDFKALMETYGAKDDDPISYIDIHGDHVPELTRFKSGSLRVVDGESVEDRLARRLDELKAGVI